MTTIKSEVARLTLSKIGRSMVEMMDADAEKVDEFIEGLEVIVARAESDARERAIEAFRMSCRELRTDKIGCMRSPGVDIICRKSSCPRIECFIKVYNALTPMEMPRIPKSLFLAMGMAAFADSNPGPFDAERTSKQASDPEWSRKLCKSCEFFMGVKYSSARCHNPKSQACERYKKHKASKH